MPNSILLIDDEQAILNSLSVLLAQNGIYDLDVLQDSTQAFDLIERGRYGIIILDMAMPQVTGLDILEYVRKEHLPIECIILTGVGDVEMAVQAMKLGAFDYLTKPVSEERLIFTIQRAVERVAMRQELNALRSGLTRSDLKHPQAFEEILTISPRMLSVLMKVEQIAPTNGTVLIWGESGTGKELIARAIHRLSRRSEKPFVAVNAGVFAADLFASEFFGHSKGAFTGATEARRGFVDEADGGTLFLDEIGELPLDVQVKLLRVLQEGEFFRVGSTTPRKADLRVIASTNKDLYREIQTGAFRKDLFYRLNLNSILLPPLREREGDIPYLAHQFLYRSAREHGRDIRDFSDAALEVLVRYDYPGNVREIENVIASAVVLEQGPLLSQEVLPTYLLEASRKQRKLQPKPDGRIRAASEANLCTLDELDRAHILRVLEATGGNRTQAAKILGLSRAGLLQKLKRYDLSRP